MAYPDNPEVASSYSFQIYGSKPGIFCFLFIFHTLQLSHNCKVIVRGLLNITFEAEHLLSFVSKVFCEDLKRQAESWDPCYKTLRPNKLVRLALINTYNNYTLHFQLC